MDAMGQKLEGSLILHSKEIDASEHREVEVQQLPFPFGKLGLFSEQFVGFRKGMRFLLVFFGSPLNPVRFSCPTVFPMIFVQGTSMWLGSLESARAWQALQKMR